MTLIDFLHGGKRIINLDESWVNHTAYHSRKWRKPGSTNSNPEVKMQNRVTLIVAIDNLGNSYFSLLETNSNMTTMGMFLMNLVKVLD